jgi:hypothetical protein
MRKVIIWLIVLAIIAGAVYGWMTYSVVGLYEPETPKVTYLFIVEKPERGFDFFYNHIDKARTEKLVANYKRRNDDLPWHMDYNWVVNNSVYFFTMDNRFMDKQ